MFFILVEIKKLENQGQLTCDTERPAISREGGILPVVADGCGLGWQEPFVQDDLVWWAVEGHSLPLMQEEAWDIWKI